MFPAESSRTERRALVDYDPSARGTFARRSLEWAAEHGYASLVWHFNSKDNVRHLSGPRGLGPTMTALARTGRHSIGGVTVLLATPRADPGSHGLPCAAWWPSDDRLLELDAGDRPLLDTLVSRTSRAPMWLTAFDVDAGEPVGLAGDEPWATDIAPIVVPSEVQDLVDGYSASMNLTNGAHDSSAGPLISATRRLVKGGLPREAIGVAALRAGWWPQRVPDLLKKL